MSDENLNFNWEGRDDRNEDPRSLRWHQLVQPWDNDAEPGTVVLAGFCCDEGVSRNKGREGARLGPDAIRRQLANLSWFGGPVAKDAGNIHVENADLEQAQEAMAARLEGILVKGGFPLALGGGHEMAWSSFLACRRYLEGVNGHARLGVLNLDAHLDMRPDNQGPTSGTAFYQAEQYCREFEHGFFYHCIGLSASANGGGLFSKAAEAGATWREDVHCHISDLPAVFDELLEFLENIDYLYLTICMDVFSVSQSPGVSAPAAIGVDSLFVIRLLRQLVALCREAKTELLMADIAETCPPMDIDNRTARLAARLCWEIASGVQTDKIHCKK